MLRTTQLFDWGMQTCEKGKHFDLLCQEDDPGDGGCRGGALKCEEKTVVTKSRDTQQLQLGPELLSSGSHSQDVGLPQGNFVDHSMGLISMLIRFEPFHLNIMETPNCPANMIRSTDW